MRVRYAAYTVPHFFSEGCGIQSCRISFPFIMTEDNP